MKTVEIAFAIGATLSSGFKSTIGGAGKQAKLLGDSISRIKAGQKQISSFTALQAGINQTGRELIQARTRFNELKQEIRATDHPTQKLKNNLAAAGKTVSRLEEKLKKQRRSLGDVRKEMTAAGLSTRNLAGQQHKLTTALDRTKRAQDRLNQAMQKHQAIQSRRERLRGKLVEAAALGASAAAPGITAAAIQESEIRLSTVINAQDKDKAMKEARTSARALARTGLVTFADAYNAQYALNSAGLTAAASRSASAVVAKVAKVTSGIPESVGEVIATTYNNLGKQLEGTTEEKLTRIGDLLTKVQFKYQIRDFDQLGESMKEASSGLAGYNVNVNQGVMLLGQLNSAGLQGGRAGTALKAVLRSLNKAQADWGSEIVRNKDGQLDMIATLESVNNVLGDMYGDDVDQRAAAIQKVFGEEGAAGIVPLLGKLKELKEAQQDVTEGSKGLVDREVVKFTSSATGQWNKMRNSMVVLADAMGRVLLPTAGKVMGMIASGANKLADFAEKGSGLTKIIVGLTGGLAAGTAAVIAGSYAFTFIHGGVMNVVKAYQILRSSTLLAKAAQMGLNLAMRMNPIGMIITGVAIVGAALVALYKNCEPFRKFVDNLWEKIKKIGGYILKLAKMTPIGKLISFIGRKVSSGSETAKALNLTPGGPTPSIPNLAAATKAVNNKSEFKLNVAPNIHLAPGVDGPAVRQAVTQAMSESTGLLKQNMEALMNNERRLAYG